MTSHNYRSAPRENLLTLPLWARLTGLGVLLGGVTIGLTLLFASGLSESQRTAGGQLLLITLPALAVAVGLLGASWARTEQIDAMIAKFLRQTVGDKLESYLVPPAHGRLNPHFPPLFRRMERSFSDEITSFCHYHLYADGERQFDVMVKSNVFNIELSFVLVLASPPPGWSEEMRGCSYIFSSVDDWPAASANPLATLASETVFGSLAEGYTILIDSDSASDGPLHVRFRLRQRITENFLTSPYLRRYFAEDIALALYYIYSEVFSRANETLLGGRF